MQKAFIFDMDGVLVDSEPVWVELEREYLPEFFGSDIAARMGDLVGLGVDDLMERARSLGAVFERRDYLLKADEMAKDVYARAPITAGVSELARNLISNDFKIGLVSQSPRSWIDQVLARLTFRNNIEAILSLYEHVELKRKPEPDGLLEAFGKLNAEPKHSIILEDSNVGIQAGKASGAFTIGYRGNLLDGYEQEGADAYADTMADVAALVEQFDARV